MAVNEKDVLLNKKSNGDTDILYPITLKDNVIGLEDLETPRSKTITLAVANWTINEETNQYEYIIEDDTITESHLIDGRMDLSNQRKMDNGIIESYNGGYKVVTSKLPTQEITMTVTIQKTVQEGGV